MILADLIKGKKTSTVLNSATATLATVATATPFPAVFLRSVARVATVAVAESEQTDIFAPDYQNGLPAANDGKDKPLYCVAGDCWCSQKLPEHNHPAGCADCEYLTKAAAP